MRYYYGMRLRPAGLGCQPKEGLQRIIWDMTPEQAAKYHDVVEYDRELTEEEREHYDMDLIGTVEG